MKNKKPILLFLLVLGMTLNLYSQNDLAKLILEMRDSSEIIVKNSRKLINTKLHENQLSEIPPIIAYCDQTVDRYSYIAFYPWEKQVLYLLANDLDNFFTAVADTAFNSYAIPPTADYLGQYAVSLLIKDRQEKQEWYSLLDLPEEKKLTIRIMLGAINVFDDDLENKRIVNLFIKKYQDSKYLSFVTSYKNSFQSGTFEFEFGGGYYQLNGPVSNLVKPDHAFYFGMGGFSNKVYWSLYFLGAANTTLILPYTFTSSSGETYSLTQGEDLSHLDFGLKLGYLVYKSNRVKLFPLCSVSANTFEMPIKTGRNEEGVSINSSFNLGLGVCSDFDLFRWKSTSMETNTTSHLGLRISAGYHTMLTKNTLFQGNGYSATISLLWWFGSL